MRYLVLMLNVLILFSSCIYLDHSGLDSDTIIASTKHPAIINMVKRAQQIANINWTPIDSIPDRVGYYPAKVTVKGLPYSSVKERDKFIGQDVSIHTFMTAVHNPRSVLYTERVNKPPYHGINCGAYYGTVCNIAVNYALGLEIPYSTYMYKDSGLFYEVQPNEINSIAEGDVLWSPGHVVLVLDILRDTLSVVTKISILESAGNTSIKEYTLNAFKDRWEKDGWVAYRYKDLYKETLYQQIPFVSVFGETPMNFQYNDDICTSRGDKVCYRENESIVINVLNDSYNLLELYKGQVLYKTIPLIHEDSIELDGLPYGMYKARLTNSSNSSDFCSFEIVETKVSIESDENNCTVYFNSSNAIANYIVFCTINGGQRELEVISELERANGKKIMRKPNDDEFVKVYFHGEYGRVTNEPISSEYLHSLHEEND